MDAFNDAMNDPYKGLEYYLNAWSDEPRQR